MADSNLEKRTTPQVAADETNGTSRLGSVNDLDNLTVLGYKPELRRNRSMFTLLFQSLAIAAVRCRSRVNKVQD